MFYNESTLERPIIVITVYNRKDHIKQCLESIETAEGAEFYHVVVGSDAPASASHQVEIEEVRKYLLEKENNNNFDRLSLIFHKENIGQRENIKKCNSLAKSLGYQTFIMMEDDIVVGESFLDFMSEGLYKYRDCEQVLAVNGYLDPTLNSFEKKPFLYNRFNAYGFASWYEKWDLVVEKRNANNYADKVLSDIDLFRKQAELSVNVKSYPFLAERFYRAGDIEVGLLMELEGLYTLQSHVSLTANRGMDGSGLRSGADPVLQAMEPSHEKIEVTEPSNIKRFKLEEIKDKIQFKYIAANWFSFIVYKYIPFGFEILKRLRTIKKSL